MGGALRVYASTVGSKDTMSSEEGPILSNTFKSSQLMTPREPSRVTIDNPHYQGYLVSHASTSPDGILKRVSSGNMGDNDFHLDNLNPPLKSNDIIAKELNLLFPQEHPFTSHTPQFALFPDTRPYPPTQPVTTSDPDNQEDDAKEDIVKVHAETQTPYGGIGLPQPPFPYYVKQKAFTHGMRVEQRYIGSGPAIPLVKEHGGMRWDLPRSQKHKRAYTYPAPSLQYSRPPITPHYIPPPSTGMLSSSTSNPMISPNTKKALESFQVLLNRTTTYRKYFPHPQSRVHPNSRPDYSFRSRECSHPWTTESRGKYSSPYLLSNPLEISVQSLEEGSESAPDESSVVFSTMDDDHYKHESSSLKGDVCDRENTSSPTAAEEIYSEEVEKVEIVSTWTQTEEEYFEHESVLLHHHNLEGNKFPQVSHRPFTTPMDILTSKMHKFPMMERHRISTSERSGWSQDSWSERDTRLPPQRVSSHQYGTSPGVYHHEEEKSRSIVRSKGVNVAESGVSDGVHTPRTSESARKLAELYNNFSRSEILKRFNLQYHEKAPDLRKYSIREGKRHLIQGIHSYHYH